jgi:hypothetical protein
LISSLVGGAGVSEGFSTALAALSRCFSSVPALTYTCFLYVLPVDGETNGFSTRLSGTPPFPILGLTTGTFASNTGSIGISFLIDHPTNI